VSADHRNPTMAGFEDLNGVAINLVRFIADHACTTIPEAKRLLADNKKTYGAKPLLDAFAITQAEMTTRKLEKPYAYLLAAARGMREKARPKKFALSRW
jgi:hypothetical protein